MALRYSVPSTAQTPQDGWVGWDELVLKLFQLHIMICIFEFILGSRDLPSLFSISIFILSLFLYFFFLDAGA